jgi:YebC/PmpR family DNA-binding regulatory protein
MAGHSKWKNIQHRKGAQDSKRGKVFTKIAVEITVAARMSGGNPDDNPRLRAALLKAKAANMPKDNWQRAIKKGTGELEGADYIEKTYEGYGPGGVAVLVECLTDNVNRTVGDVRHAFTRCGGNLGQDGSVGWIFERKGVIVYQREHIGDFDKFFELAIDSGAEDVEEQDSYVEVKCSVDSFIKLKNSLEESIPESPSYCDLTRIAKNSVEITANKYESLEKMVNVLEDNDDVQNVYHNAELDR